MTKNLAAVGRAVGIRMFPVLQPDGTRMDAVVMGVVSPAMLSVKRIPRHRHHITLRQLQQVSVAPYLAITVGVKQMKLSL
jgi:hypothetical protein